VPAGFEDYVLLSQLQAAEIMKYTVEHLRRDSEYCSGVIIWQLNDCWPVIPCSAVDYNGRWKALQYYKKRFFAPVLISARDEGTRVQLWVSNERREPFDGNVEWQLADARGTELRSGRLPVTAAAGQSRACASLDFTDLVTAGNRDRVCLFCRLLSGAADIGAGTVLFLLPKDFHFERPQINVTSRTAATGTRSASRRTASPSPSSSTRGPATASSLTTGLTCHPAGPG
jgi:beta-mannosidase